jgi:hypothetical protein
MRKRRGRSERRRRGRMRGRIQRSMRGRIKRRTRRRLKKSQSPGRGTRGKTKRQEDKEKGKNEVSSLGDGRWEMGDGKEERQTDPL